MRNPLLRTRALRQLTLANALLGLSSSFAVPFIPIFLATSVRASASQIGVLLTLSGAGGVLISSAFGSLSDRLPSRKPLIAAACVSGAACDVVYAGTPSYAVALAASVTLLSGLWLAVPQLYARCRELLDAGGAPAALSLSTLRSVVSVAWIGGPPLAGLLLTVTGYPQLFLVVAVLLLATAALVMADGTREVHRPGRPAEGWGRLLSRAARSPFPGLATGGVLSAGAIVLLQTANSMATITTPLLVTQTLHGTTRDVGLIFGLSAGLEIPCLVGLGWAAGRFGYLRALLVSWLVGPLYFVAMAAVTGTWQIAIAQVLSAIYVAGLVGVALAYFQDLLAEPGSASTLYFNGITAGNTIAGVLWGVAVAAGGYRGAYVACLLLAVASTVLLVTGHRQRRRPAGPEAPPADVR
jgi:SET family sugar efflux transporter-like MFS transporter